MDKPAVINASPLIILARGRQINLLRHFAKRILVPEPVAHEISMRGPDDMTSRLIHQTPWIEILSPMRIPDGIIRWGLGIGESSVLAYASEHTGTEAIIDDLAGRKCAASLGIPVRGTLGIVLASKKRGIISEARPVIETLIKSGLYLSKSVVEEALSRVDE